MKRKEFIQTAGILGSGVLLSKFSIAAPYDFPVVRVPMDERKFLSPSVEAAIKEFQAGVKNKEIAWLFGNCFPNTLDTTVTHKMVDGRPDTYVITGDIDAMWLRDSTAQVWPYLSLVKQDESLQHLIAGVINRQTRCINNDPYANAFYDDPDKQGEWKSDITDMKAGVHERKWEIDSICYPVRLAYNYWRKTGDTRPFDDDHKKSIGTILQTFKDQQRKTSEGPYKFQRLTVHTTDTQPMSGYGYPVNPVGLICSAFRPSDDATVFPFLVPSNFFAVKSLRQMAEFSIQIYKDRALAAEMVKLANEVEAALMKYAVADHPIYGKVYAFEVDGFGNKYLMDDANVPSLLGMPYLETIRASDPIYKNTRKLVLSSANPYFYRGTAAEGIGGPHVGKDMIWPIAITVRGLTSTDDKEIAACIELLRKTHAGSGFMHESFHKDDPKKFTRSWFAWANTLFGEFLWKVYKERPQLLK